LDLVGRVAEIWRYPMSSVGGERVPRAKLSAVGLEGDRQFSLIDAETGKPAAPEKDHRWRKALHLEARSVEGDLPAIFFQNGQSCGLGEPTLTSILSDYFGFAVGIAAYAHTGRVDFPLIHYRYPHFPAHVLTKNSLRHLASLGNVETVDSRRFRPTFLIDLDKGDGFIEHQWIGRHLKLGSIDLTAQEETKRCGMTFISQPGVDEDPEILRNILRHNKRNLGVYCSIDNAGTIQVGDEFLIECARRQVMHCPL
jgi:uncharacterized protein YcbX